MSKPRAQAALLLFSIALAAAQTPPPARQNEVERGRQFLGLGAPADPVAAARGQTTFEANCSFCHGKDAKGAEAPDLLRSTTVLHDEHGETITTVVKNGRLDRGMPAFPALTADQLRDLAEFLHSRVQAAANRFSYHLLNIVTGNASAGQQFFTAHCAACHNPAGDLAHISKRFEPADLQAQFLYPSGPHLTATVEQPDGHPFTGAVQSVDDFTVVLKNAAGEIRSFDRANLSVTFTDPLEGHRQLLDTYTNADMHNILAYLVSLP